MSSSSIAFSVSFNSKCNFEFSVGCNNTFVAFPPLEARAAWAGTMLDVILAWWPWLLAGFITGRVLVWIRPLDALPGLPLLGNVVALSRHGTAYISHARRKARKPHAIDLLRSATSCTA